MQPILETATELGNIQNVIQPCKIMGLETLNGRTNYRDCIEAIRVESTRIERDRSFTGPVMS